MKKLALLISSMLLVGANAVAAEKTQTYTVVAVVENTCSVENKVGDDLIIDTDAGEQGNAVITCNDPAGATITLASSNNGLELVAGHVEGETPRHNYDVAMSIVGADDLTLTTNGSGVLNPATLTVSDSADVELLAAGIDAAIRVTVNDSINTAIAGRYEDTLTLTIASTLNP